MSVFTQILERYDITDYLVSQGIPYTSAGKKHKLNCPLPGHTDNNASFHVFDDPESEVAHCFGCGFHGNLFKFIGVLENKSTWEAAREIAINMGIEVAVGTKEYEDLKAFEEAIKIVSYVEQQSIVYSNNLLNHTEAFEYLTKVRGFNNDSIAYFNLGWNSSKSCITIPLKDRFNRPMCFVEHYFGTYLKPGGKKYVVPSNELPIAKLGFYKKAAYFHNLHGIDLVDEDTLYLVEGYMDVVAMHQLGYKNTLAITTALMTHEQVRRLYDITKPSTNIVFVPDTDLPGFNAVVSNIEHFRNVETGVYRGVQVINVADNPTIKDANDWLIQKNCLLPEPVYAETYQAIKVCNNTSNQEAQLWQIRQIAQKASLPAKVELAKTFASDFGIPEERLAAELDVSINSCNTSYGGPLGDVEAVRAYIKFCHEEGIKAGFGTRINDLIMGLHPGELVGLAGRSNTGKTTIACDYLWNQKEQGSEPPTIIFSMEMTKEEIMLKHHQMATGLTTPELYEIYLKDPLFTPWDENPFPYVYVWDQPALSLSEIEKIIKRLELSYFDGPVKQVIIDHAQLLQGEGKNSYERVSAVARDLLSFARRTKIVTLVLSQVSRQGGKSGGAPVSMDDSRDSGVFEEVLDFFIGIWRPFYDLSVEAQLEAKKIEAESGDNVCAESSIMFRINKSTRGGRETIVSGYMQPSLRVRFADNNESQWELANGCEATDQFDDPAMIVPEKLLENNDH